MTEAKGKSPFNPGQPVPAELFTGRQLEIDRIMQRCVGQTALGKPTAVFIQGEYGIGKSSVALYTQSAADVEHKLIGLYATLGGAKTLDDVAARILEATVRSGLYDRTWREHVQTWLGKYIGKQSLFGVSVNFEAMKQDAPKLASAGSTLSFLEEVQQRNHDVRAGKGVFLILDEINGIATNPDFAHFLKSLVDSNAFRNPRLPLLLMLCGVEERRRELIRSHQPVDRLFDIIDIPPMSDAESAEFFTDAFESVGMTVEATAMHQLVQASAGQPKIMHTVGDCVFWQTGGKDRVGYPEARVGILDAAEEVGKRYVDSQIFAAIQSKDYQSILKKLAKALGSRGEQFTRKGLAAKLSASESGKLDNFLQKMKALNVIKPGDIRGSYRFRISMVQMYIWLHFLRTPVTGEG